MYHLSAPHSIFSFLSTGKIINSWKASQAQNLMENSSSFSGRPYLPEKIATWNF